MNSFTLIAIGNLARNPELTAKDDTLYARFCLVGNDYGGRNEDGEARQVATSIWFVAFGHLAESITKNARKGDQLIVTAQMKSNTWIDRQGETQYDYSFIAQGFRFGAPGKAKREELAAMREENGSDGDGEGEDEVTRIGIELQA
jgi:single-strand DNA-binding protein